MNLEFRPLLILLMLAPCATSSAAVLDSCSMKSIPGVSLEGSQGANRIKKGGLFQQLRAFKAAKRFLRNQTQEPAKASKMAHIALALFLAPYALSFLSGISVVFSILLGAAFITSVALSILILAEEDNPKSRKIARMILIVDGVLLVVGTILILALVNALKN